MQTKKEDIMLYYKEGENELVKEKNPYRAEPCPFCGKFAVGGCRCPGPHNLEQLKKGHGLRCPNGHHFTNKGKLGYDPKTGNVFDENLVKENTGTIIDKKPTQDMLEFFINRTENHINLVKTNIEKILDYLPHLQKEELLNRIPLHDQDKFKEPNFTPYVWTTWMYKCKKDNTPFEYPEGMREKSNDATIRHVLMCPHHPEYFAGEAPINQDNRDMANHSIDASNMKPVDIIEMICDWKAVGQERGNTARSWYEKNVPSRWEFTDKQKELIEEILKILE